VTTTVFPAAGSTTALPYPLALDALHRRCAPGRLVASASGYVLASAVTLPHAPPGPLHRFGLACVDADAESAFAEGPIADRFAVGLLDLQHDLLRHTLEHTVAHLGGRTSAGETLLTKQLVGGQLADVGLRLSEDAALPPARRHGDRPATWRTHQRLVAVGRDLLRLLGASGFLADGPAGDLHAAEVVGNVYLHPGTEDPDA
jgi:hypothetical protein